jgi:hypothetical protein
MIDNDGRQDGVRRDDAGEVIARAWGAIQHLLRNLYDLPNDRSLLSSEDILKVRIHMSVIITSKLRSCMQIYWPPRPNCDTGAKCNGILWSTCIANVGASFRSATCPGSANGTRRLLTPKAM